MLNVLVVVIPASVELFLTAESVINDGNNHYMMLKFPVLGFIFCSGLELNLASSAFVGDILFRGFAGET